MLRKTWNGDFVRSFKDFFAFAEWDNGKTPEDELKAVWAECVPTNELNADLKKVIDGISSLEAKMNQANGSVINIPIAEPKPKENVTSTDAGTVAEPTKQGD